ncbi:UPF0271 protein [Nakamurella sp. UYEF19]|uniref:LamB/YcsF family protein n=1 Tax=Nakamurella sp. UYEF19 TaxID=1756392 RepID=UPI0033918019
MSEVRATSGERLLIDLNADLGEGFGAWRMTDDAALLDVVTSANVACGFHAGDPRTMRRVCELAAARDVRIGAHVGYRDLAGFGRRDLDVDRDELRDEVTYQIGALAGIARSCGTRVSYVKAHGALYNRAARDEVHGSALIDGILAFAKELPVLSLPGSVVLQLAAEAGLPTVTEAFPDRGYTADGALAPRSVPGSVLHDVAEVSARAVRMARDGEVVAVTGEVVRLAARSLCLHGDTPGAVALAIGTREALRGAGAALEAFA